MPETNPNSRLEAFCDGVFAIALTLLVIDIKIPASVKTDTTRDVWLALKDIAPSITTFVLSFTIIFITWVNHHNALKLVNKSSPPFIYANGFLLLTVVFLPFPTALMGGSILTNHAAPAVALYNSVLALQALGWVLMSIAGIKEHLAKNEKAIVITRQARNFGYFAFVIYSACAIIAFWFPLTIAVITVIIWIFWLGYGISIKEE